MTIQATGKTFDLDIEQDSELHTSSTDLLHENHTLVTFRR